MIFGSLAQEAVEQKRMERLKISKTAKKSDQDALSSRKNKIAILSNTRGGVLTYTNTLIKEVTKRGFQISVYFISSSNESHNFEPNSEIHFLTVLNYIINPVALRRFFNRKTDLVQANFATVGSLAVVLKFVFKIPFVLSLHGLPQPWLNRKITDKIKYSIERKLMRFVGSRASAIIVVSNYVKDGLIRNFGLQSKVIHHGIDISSISPFDRKWAKKIIGFKETDFVVLFVGKLIPYKDPFTLLKGIRYASNKQKDLRLIVVGTGELDKEIRSKTRKLKLEDKVTFFGLINTEQLRMCYSAADLFILPSVNEAFGIVLLEAMAFGLPIIASNTGACPEVVGNAGLLFNQGDYEDLGEKILRVMTNQNLRRKLSEYGLRRVTQTFSIEEQIAKYISLYKNIISAE